MHEPPNNLLPWSCNTLFSVPNLAISTLFALTAWWAHKLVVGNRDVEHNL